MTVQAPATGAPTFEELLDQWQQYVRQLADLKVREMDLRKALCAAAFPAPKEGINTFEMADGRVLKMTHKISRSVDKAAVLPTIKALQELKLNSVVVDDLFVTKWDLGVKAYKALSEEAKRLADQAITSKPGAPDLKVV